MGNALILISIVLGVAITFELENLHRLIRSKNVKWHWAQAIFAMFAMLLIVFFWWTFANESDSPITIGEFLPIMGILILLVLISAVALPEKATDDDPIDMAKYYVENRRYQWTLVLCAMLPVALNWLFVLYGRGGLWFAVVNGWGEWFPALVIVWLIFADRWWRVALGYAAIAFVPLAWLSRSLG